MSEFINSVLSGLIAGAVVVIAQQLYLNRREKQKALFLQQQHEKEIAKGKLITVQSSDKTITGEVIWSLKPGASIEFMRHLLGVPLKYTDKEYSLFDDLALEQGPSESSAFHSYLYIFKNASLKICTLDNHTVSAITVFALEGGLKIPTLDYVIDEVETTGVLGEVKVSTTLLERCQKHDYVATRIDSCFALQCFIPFNISMGYTFFGYAPDIMHDYFESKDSSIFLGREIWGLCLSNDDNAFFIYDIETR